MQVAYSARVKAAAAVVARYLAYFLPIRSLCLGSLQAGADRRAFTRTPGGKCRLEWVGSWVAVLKCRYQIRRDDQAARAHQIVFAPPGRHTGGPL